MTALTITEGLKFAIRGQRRAPDVRWYVSDASGTTLGDYSTRDEAERAAAAPSALPTGDVR